MRVLVACEFSGAVRDAFAERGHDAWSCDLEPPETPGNHIMDDVRNVLELGWDLMIAHPPCTYLTNAGVRHLHSTPSVNGVVTRVHGESRWEAMREGAKFFLDLKNAPIDKIAIENPIPHRYAREIIGPYDQIIQPWEFGHPETKATCLWLKGLPPLRPTEINGERFKRSIFKAPPTPDRAKNRSRTFSGIAKAMAQQWGH
jgi:hypothetical protein